MKDIYHSTDRQIAIDVLRGYFILSMASAHLASGFVSDLLHIWSWVDGATGFVCLSGFVLGLSQRAKWNRGDGRKAKIWILERAAFIWLVSVLLAFTALSVRLFTDDLEFIEDIFTEHRIASGIVDVLLLQLDVPYFGILTMYVVFLGFAFIAVSALQKRQAYLVVLISLAVYVVTQMGLSAGTISPVDSAFVQPAWQVLFFIGMVAGWTWKETLFPSLRKRRWQLFAVSALGTVIFFYLSHSADIPYLRDIPHLQDAEVDLVPYFDKYRLDPGVLVYFLCVVSFLGTLVGVAWNVKAARPVLRLVATYGRHSLACYVILSLVHLSVWVIAVPPDPHSARHVAWFALAVSLFTAYCLLAERPKTPRLAVRASYAPTAAVRNSST